MKRMYRWLGLLAAGVLAVIPAMASIDAARVGAVESVDGRVSVNQTVVQKQATLPVVDRDGTLQTADGHAEMILTPGVFLRLGKDSQVRLLNDSITDTRIGLERGSAILEVDELHKENRIQVNVADASALIAKKGLYRFDAQPSIAAVDVIKGQADIQGEDSHTVKAKGNKRVTISNGQLNVSHLEEAQDDDLARWSRLRSQYESEASIASAQYIYDRGWGWGFSNWFWNPWYSTWAWVPGGPAFITLTAFTTGVRRSSTGTSHFERTDLPAAVSGTVRDGQACTAHPPPAARSHPRIGE